MILFLFLIIPIFFPDEATMCNCKLSEAQPTQLVINKAKINPDSSSAQI